MSPLSTKYWFIFFCFSKYGIFINVHVTMRRTRYDATAHRYYYIRSIGLVVLVADCIRIVCSKRKGWVCIRVTYNMQRAMCNVYTVAVRLYIYICILYHIDCMHFAYKPCKVWRLWVMCSWFSYFVNILLWILSWCLMFSVNKLKFSFLPQNKQNRIHKFNHFRINLSSSMVLQPTEYHEWWMAQHMNIWLCVQWTQHVRQTAYIYIFYLFNSFNSVTEIECKRLQRKKKDSSGMPEKETSMMKISF